MRVRDPIGALMRSVSTLKPQNAAPVPMAPRTAASSLFSNTKSTRELSAMGSVGTLFAIVNQLSTAVAQVEWKLWKPAKSGIKEERTPVLDHPALVVWNKPNKFYTRQEFVETFQQHVDLVGEGWWVVSYIGNKPIELWPIRPDRMEPDKHPTDFITGYTFTSTDGQKVKLGLNEVVMLRMPNPVDPYRGLGPVQSLLLDLDSSRLASEYNRNFYFNSALPGAVITYPEEISDDGIARLQAQLADEHQGVSNAHRTLILENAAKFGNRGYSKRDMQWVQEIPVIRDRILEAFAYPKAMLGIVEDVNRANAQTLMAVFAENHVKPRLERIKLALNHDFLPLFGSFGKGVEFDYENPVPQDSEAQNAERDSVIQAYATLINAGVNSEDAAGYLRIPNMRVEKGGASNGAEQLAQSR